MKERCKRVLQNITINLPDAHGSDFFLSMSDRGNYRASLLRKLGYSGRRNDCDSLILGINLSISSKVGVNCTFIFVGTYSGEKFLYNA